MNAVIETERLLLRELTPEDFDALYAVLADADIMQYYPYTFDENRVRDWIARNMTRYRKDGFGLWAVVLKESGEMIGDCGLTLQNIDGELLPEIGYHIRKDHQRKGYAREAAAAVRDWAFLKTDYSRLGMKKVKEYPNAENEITCVYAISKEEWLAGGILSQ